MLYCDGEMCLTVSCELQEPKPEDELPVMPEAPVAAVQPVQEPMEM